MTKIFDENGNAFEGKIKVAYDGDCRGNESFDYMQSEIFYDEDACECRLYAEFLNAKIDPECYDPMAAYKPLREMILEQAAECGLTESDLDFQFDDIM